MASVRSPSSSPRLPSPPPIAEVQLGPPSPLPASEEQQQKLLSTLDHGASRRIRPGTKAHDMAEGPPLIDLSEIDSAFQLTEHLKALHNSLTHPAGSDSTTAVDRDMAHKLATPPDTVDRTLWLYELCRFLTQKVNAIIIALFSDAPPCSSGTCPEMRASEWQYLCAVHDPPKSCCAIDYCCHTLDWAANTLTSPKNFPSRLAMGTDQSTQHQQVRNLTNIFRRVYRIFAHAWFQHREMFWKVEGRTGLYILFKTVCDVYGLIPEDNYTIPPEAEGEELSEEPSKALPMILKREPSGPGPLDAENASVIEGGDHVLSTAGTTKRHRHSPSVGVTSVTTVVEESEEEEPAEKTSLAQEEENAAASDDESIAEAVVDTPEGTEPDVEHDASVKTEPAEETEAATAADSSSHATGEGAEKQVPSGADGELQANESAVDVEATPGDESARAEAEAEREAEAESEAESAPAPAPAPAPGEKSTEEAMLGQEDTEGGHASAAQAEVEPGPGPEKAEKEEKDEAGGDGRDPAAAAAAATAGV